MKDDGLNVQIDLAGRYRRQVYLITFPVGALLSAGYLLISASKAAPINVFISLAVSAILLGLFFLLWWKPDFLNTAELIFYFSLCLYFVMYAHFNVNIPGRIPSLTQEQLNDVIAGMGMWLVIMFIGAFLSISLNQFKVLISVNFLTLLLIALFNLYLLRKAGVYDFGFLYRWLNVIFAVIVTILLIQRIGRLQQLYASTDTLTGLLNRRAMYDALLNEARRTDRYKKPFSVILFDLDKFKHINDTYGHVTGDCTLQAISRIVKNQIRDIDYLSRWGGEEFLVVLLEADLEKCFQVAERIRKAVNEYSFEKAGHVTASFGAATFTPGQSLDDLLHIVDLEMYAAKHKGGNQVSSAVMAGGNTTVS